MATRFQLLVTRLLVLLLLVGNSCTISLSAPGRGVPVRTEYGAPAEARVESAADQTDGDVPVRGAAGYGTTTEAPVRDTAIPSGAKAPAGGVPGLGAEALIGDHEEADKQSPPKQQPQMK